MQKFAAKETTGKDFVRYELSGYVDERAKLPSLKRANLISISLKDVTGLNSVGTRTWCKWVEEMVPPTLVRIEGCPAIFVKTFNQVTGAIRKNIEIDSFFVPYICDQSGERADVLFVLNQHFDSKGTVKIPEVRSTQGNIMEIDVRPEYFRFLKR